MTQSHCLKKTWTWETQFPKRCIPVRLPVQWRTYCRHGVDSYNSCQKQYKRKTRGFRTFSCFGPHIWKHDGNWSHGKFSEFIPFCSLVFRTHHFSDLYRTLEQVGRLYCQAKHRKLFADNTLTSEPPNQLLMSVASCIVFWKQGNNNDKLKATECECVWWGWGGGGRNCTSAVWF